MDGTVVGPEQGEKSCRVGLASNTPAMLVITRVNCANPFTLLNATSCLFRFSCSASLSSIFLIGSSAAFRCGSSTFDYFLSAKIHQERRVLCGDTHSLSTQEAHQNSNVAQASIKTESQTTLQASSVLVDDAGCVIYVIGLQLMIVGCNLHKKCFNRVMEGLRHVHCE